MFNIFLKRFYAAVHLGDNKDLEEALKSMTCPESLEGENQYFCEKCNKKVNAKRRYRSIGSLGVRKQVLKEGNEFIFCGNKRCGAKCLDDWVILSESRTWSH